MIPVSRAAPTWAGEWHRAAANTRDGWSLLPWTSAKSCQLPPQERQWQAHAGHFFANDIPELAQFGFDRRSLAAEHPEEEARIVGQPAGAEGEPVGDIDRGLGPLPDPLGLCFGGAQENVAEHVERAHHCGLTHGETLRLDQKLLAKQQGGV